MSRLSPINVLILLSISVRNLILSGDIAPSVLIAICEIRNLSQGVLFFKILCSCCCAPYVDESHE